MIRTLLAATALLITTACATTEPESQPMDAADFQAAAQIIDTPEPRTVEIVRQTVPLPLPGQMKPIRARASGAPQTQLSPADAVRRGREGALIEPSVDGYVNAIQVYPYTEGALFRLYASPGQVSDIALQPGETLVSVSAGDTVRWVVGDTLSGSGPKARAHVLVKPISAGIRTNLMIATDRRTYHLELESTGGGYMAALSWRYPADELATLTTQNTQAAAQAASSVENSLSLSDLNFDYRLTGDNPDWKPVRVFDDGRQVFIQMPDTIAATDMPPLFVIGESGAELVNYRVKSKYYIVDRLFRAAELRIGTKKQTVVRIEKARPRTGLAALFGS